MRSGRDPERLKHSIRVVELPNASEYRNGVASVTETRRTLQQSDGPRGIPEVTGGDEPRVDLEEVFNGAWFVEEFETFEKTENGGVGVRSGCDELANRRSFCHSSPAWILRVDSGVDSEIAINQGSYLCWDWGASTDYRCKGERRRRRKEKSFSVKNLKRDPLREQEDTGFPNQVRSCQRGVLKSNNLEGTRHQTNQSIKPNANNQNQNQNQNRTRPIFI